MILITHSQSVSLHRHQLESAVLSVSRGERASETMEENLISSRAHGTRAFFLYIPNSIWHFFVLLLLFLHLNTPQKAWRLSELGVDYHRDAVHAVVPLLCLPFSSHFPPDVRQMSFKHGHIGSFSSFGTMNDHTQILS